MGFDPDYVDAEEYFEGQEEDKLYDKYEQDAATQILELVSQFKIVTDRELKVRLGKCFFPWVVGRGVNRLVSDGEIRVVHPPGRKGSMGSPDNFFMDPNGDYDKLIGLILKKRRISAYVNSLLTRASPAGFFAEELFDIAFQTLQFKIHGYDVSEFRGKKVTSIAGKEPPNLDFIIEKDKIVYGVDVKNWIKFEFDTKIEVMDKVKLAQELGIVPFICARYIDKETFHNIVEIPGIVYMYRTLIIPPEFREIAEEASTLLGYPVLCAPALPNYKLEFIKSLNDIVVNRSCK